MFKLIPPVNLNPATKTKCGEIFYHNFNDFTILCCFCQMKSFHFDDFILHIQNVHFENLQHKIGKVLEPNGNEFNPENIKNEIKLSVTEDEILVNDMENTSRSETEEDVESYWDEEKLLILKTPLNTFTNYKSKCPNVKKKATAKDESKLQKKRSFQKFKHQDNVESLSPPNKKYPCTECNEIYSQKKHLDQHVFELHNGYKCSLCDKRFRRSNHMVSHEKTHNKEKNFFCSIESCRRGFTDEVYLKRHLEMHTMERNFKCDYENCGKAFQTFRRLNSHKYTHKFPMKFVCDMCGRGCRSNIELSTHQRVHTGEKPFPCEVCSKPFISKVALKEHMISHSALRPYVCDVCNAAFANRRVLLRHIFIHKKEKTFKCKLCESAFRHPNSLQGHMRNVHRKSEMKVTNTLLRDK